MPISFITTAGQIFSNSDTLAVRGLEFPRVFKIRKNGTPLYGYIGGDIESLEVSQLYYILAACSIELPLLSLDSKGKRGVKLGGSYSRMVFPGYDLRLVGDTILETKEATLVIFNTVLNKGHDSKRAKDHLLKLTGKKQKNAIKATYSTSPDNEEKGENDGVDNGNSFRVASQKVYIRHALAFDYKALLLMLKDENFFPYLIEGESIIHMLTGMLTPNDKGIAYIDKVGGDGVNRENFHNILSQAFDKIQPHVIDNHFKLLDNINRSKDPAIMLTLNANKVWRSKFWDIISRDNNDPLQIFFGQKQPGIQDVELFKKLLSLKPDSLLDKAYDGKIYFIQLAKQLQAAQDQSLIIIARQYITRLQQSEIGELVMELIQAQETIDLEFFANLGLQKTLTFQFKNKRADAIRDLIINAKEKQDALAFFYNCLRAEDKFTILTVALGYKWLADENLTLRLFHDLQDQKFVESFALYYKHGGSFMPIYSLLLTRYAHDKEMLQPYSQVLLKLAFEDEGFLDQLLDSGVDLTQSFEAIKNGKLKLLDLGHRQATHRQQFLFALQNELQGLPEKDCLEILKKGIKSVEQVLLEQSLQEQAVYKLLAIYGNELAIGKLVNGITKQTPLLEGLTRYKGKAYIFALAVRNQNEKLLRLMPPIATYMLCEDHLLREAVQDTIDKQPEEVKAYLEQALIQLKKPVDVQPAPLALTIEGGAASPMNFLASATSVINLLNSHSAKAYLWLDSILNFVKFKKSNDLQYIVLGIMDSLLLIRPAIGASYIPIKFIWDLRSLGATQAAYNLMTSVLLGVARVRANLDPLARWPRLKLVSGVVSFFVILNLIKNTAVELYSELRLSRSDSKNKCSIAVFLEPPYDYGAMEVILKTMLQILKQNNYKNLVVDTEWSRGNVEEGVIQIHKSLKRELMNLKASSITDESLLAQYTDMITYFEHILSIGSWVNNATSELRVNLLNDGSFSAIAKVAKQLCLNGENKILLTNRKDLPYMKSQLEKNFDKVNFFSVWNTASVCDTAFAMPSGISPGLLYESYHTKCLVRLNNASRPSLEKLRLAGSMLVDSKASPLKINVEKELALYISDQRGELGKHIKKANEGDVASQFELANMLGESYPVSSRHWYREAAAQGSEEAQSKLNSYSDTYWLEKNAKVVDKIPSSKLSSGLCVVGQSKIKLYGNTRQDVVHRCNSLEGSLSLDALAALECKTNPLDHILHTTKTSVITCGNYKEMYDELPSSNKEPKGVVGIAQDESGQVILY
jgi:hypothetical protein